MVAFLKNMLLDVFNRRSDRADFFAPGENARNVISCVEAVAAFDKLANMRNIAYGYTDDGCYARAHLMCRKLVDMDIVPEKAWAFETEKQDLIVHYPDGKEQSWWFHVAPVVTVDMLDGTTAKMVLDPSMFDGPVGLRQWADRMHADLSQVDVVPCGSAPESYKGDYTPFHRTNFSTDRKAEKIMRDYCSLQDTVKPSVFMSAFRRKWHSPETVREGGMPCPNPPA